MAEPLAGWLRRHDPDRHALKKAIKVAVVVTIGLAIGTLLIGNGQLSIFASFGGVAMLLFADFPGNRQARLGAYLMLYLVGVVLITLGTIASQAVWAAVAGMVIVGFLVLFSGVLSAATAGATRAALLSYVLPATVAATPADIPERLAGWTIAAVLAIPAAVLIWPPNDHDALRSKSAAALRSLGRRLTEGPVVADPDAAVAALREQFRSTTFRPVGLSSGSRQLARLVDQLGWLKPVVLHTPAPDDTSGLVSDLIRACGTVLMSGADALDDRGRSGELETALVAVESARMQVFESLELVPSTPIDPDHAADRLVHQLDGVAPALLHELVYTTKLVGRTVRTSVAADARPLLDRLLGRHIPSDAVGSYTAAQQIISRHFSVRSVWFQNSVRGAFGLSLAVLLAGVTGVGHGFWVVLGTMSVLRTSALTIGATALRALIGTFCGFLIGAGLVLLIGTSPGPLWIALPLVALVAGFAPEAVSFAAGQAAFTIMVVILFNIIQPVGWSVGLLRVEDVALGCAAGLVCGLLLWPRGARAQVGRTLSDAYQRSAEALSATVSGTPSAAQARGEAADAAARLDDAFREYLAERGSKPVPVDSLTMAIIGATRVRLAAEAIATFPGPRAVGEELTQVRRSVTDHSASARRWYEGAGAALARRGPVPDTGGMADAEQTVLTLVAYDATSLERDEPGVRVLWGAALYIDDVTRLEERLLPAVHELAGRGASRPTGGLHAQT